jgi:hypothetical protein
MTIDYARQHLHNNEFIRSLIESYDFYGSLTEIQEHYLTEAVDRHRKTRMWIRNYEGLNRGHPFYESLVSQFRERGFLTEKQLNAMVKWLH